MRGRFIAELPPWLFDDIFTFSSTCVYEGHTYTQVFKCPLCIRTPFILDSSLPLMTLFKLNSSEKTVSPNKVTF
jgi:hypothetical protein